MNKNIFTFWEPERNLPGYLKACQRTWEKYLPDYKIINCNFKNLNEYIPKEIIQKIVYKKIPLPQQADCIRAWLLYLHGGYWFDNDTILTGNELIKNMQQYECCMLGNSKTQNEINIGFIWAQKGSKIMKEWVEEVPNRVTNYKKYKRFKLFYQLFRYSEHKLRKHWNYFGNGILDSIPSQTKEKNLFILDKYNLNTLLENELINNQPQKPTELYRNFYFKKIDFKNALNKNKGVICLHNSWTPFEYKKLSEEEFLNQNITLSNLLNHILERKN